MTTGEIVGIVGGVLGAGGVGVAIVQAIAMRKLRSAKAGLDAAEACKTEADAAGVMVGVSQEVVEMLRKELVEMRSRFSLIDSEVATLRNEAWRRDKAIEAAQKDLTDCKNDRANLHAQNDHQRQQIAELEAKVRALEAAVRESGK